MGYRLFFSNVGYAKGIDGTLRQHVLRMNRHIHAPVRLQQKVLSELKAIIDAEQPDLCALVEVDSGSFHSGGYNQLDALRDQSYGFSDIADKYGENSAIGKLPFHGGKSNAFLSKQEVVYQLLYFSHGSKRLIYRIELPGETQLFFTHFSLQQKIRQRQFEELKTLMTMRPRPTILLADFNIFRGFSELAPLLEGSDLRILNSDDQPTFRFHKRQMALDLCLVSESLIGKTELKIVPQTFSDHDALILDVVTE